VCGKRAPVESLKLGWRTGRARWKFLTRQKLSGWSFFNTKAIQHLPEFRNWAPFSVSACDAIHRFCLQRDVLTDPWSLLAQYTKDPQYRPRHGLFAPTRGLVEGVTILILRLKKSCLMCSAWKVPLRAECLEHWPLGANVKEVTSCSDGSVDSAARSTGERLGPHLLSDQREERMLMSTLVVCLEIVVMMHQRCWGAYSSFCIETEV
jgi:hypothetical protein